MGCGGMLCFEISCWDKYLGIVFNNGGRILSYGIFLIFMWIVFYVDYFYYL